MENELAPGSRTEALTYFGTLVRRDLAGGAAAPPQTPSDLWGLRPHTPIKKAFGLHKSACGLQEAFLVHKKQTLRTLKQRFLCV